jgi:hypothetical protein
MAVSNNIIKRRMGRIDKTVSAFGTGRKYCFVRGSNLARNAL